MAAEIVARNPGAREGEQVTLELLMELEEILMEGVEVDPEDASHVLGDLDGRHR